MNSLKNLLALFAAKLQVQYLKNSPPPRRSVVDTFFPEAARRNYPMPIVRLDMITSVTRTTPVVTRGGVPVPIEHDDKTVQFIEPLPLMPSDKITGADLNNLRVMDGTSQRQYAQGVVQDMRDLISNSVEGMCATALTGTLSWPVRLENGWKPYSISFGETKSYTPTKLWSVADKTLTQIFADINAIAKLLRANGFGEIEFWAAADVFAVLFGKIADYTGKAIQVSIVEPGTVTVGGYTIKQMDETYVNPQTGAATAKVPDKKIMAASKSGGQKLLYCSLDEPAANFAGLPVFTQVEEKTMPARLEIVGQSKPLPIFNPNAICWSTVLA